MSLLKSVFNFNRLQLFVYLFCLSGCFFLFNQGDLNHTALSSYAYLNGHFLDFYSYNLKPVGGNDYLPSIYIIFAAFNIPLYFLDYSKVHQLLAYPIEPLIQISWWKLILVFFWISSLYVLSKITNLILENNKQKNNLVISIFATSPIAIFCIFVFSQYDIVGLFFSLIGLYFYLKKDLVRFAVFFSIAITFKYFAIVIFLPLLLLVEKRILHLLKYLFIASLFSLLQFAVYWHDSVFRGGIFKLVMGKFADAGSSFNYFILLPLSVYLIACLLLFFRKNVSDDLLKKLAVFVPIFAYGLMLVSVRWHPQWVILITPFFALAFLFIRSKKFLIVADLVGMLSFVWVVVNIWPYNVDVGMINRGPLRDYLPLPPLIISDLYSLKALNVFNSIFEVYLFIPVLIILYELYSKVHLISNPLSASYVFIRFIVGLSFFVVPALFCTFVPVQIALMFSQDAFVNTQIPQVIQSKMEATLGEIYGDKIVIQTFKSKYNSLSAVSVRLATYDRQVNGHLHMTLTDESGHVLRNQVFDADTVLNNKLFNFSFEPISESKGKNYKLMIAVPDGKSGSTLTAWIANGNQYAGGDLSYDGELFDADLAINLYYPLNKNY